MNGVSGELSNVRLAVAQNKDPRLQMDHIISNVNHSILLKAALIAEEGLSEVTTTPAHTTTTTPAHTTTTTPAHTTTTTPTSTKTIEAAKQQYQHQQQVKQQQL